MINYFQMSLIALGLMTTPTIFSENFSRTDIVNNQSLPQHVITYGDKPFLVVVKDVHGQTYYGKIRGGEDGYFSLWGEQNTIGKGVYLVIGTNRECMYNKIILVK